MSKNNNKKSIKLKWSSVFHWLTNHKSELVLFVSIMLVAAFLRLYNIRDTIVFLGDEGRDALVVKRILLDGKLTLLGPTASVGGFYLGPVYYYMILPFMAISGLDPVGAAAMVALMGTMTVALLYAQTRYWFGVWPAAIVSWLYSISPGIVSFSRSSWNPNPMPLFSLASLMSTYWGIKLKRPVLAFIGGVWFGIMIQLHYLGLVFAGFLGLSTLLFARRLNLVKFWVAQILGFLTGFSMFLAFEFRHGFPNTQTIIAFVSRTGDTTGFRNPNLIEMFIEINRFNLESVLGRWSMNYTFSLVYLFFGLVVFGLTVYRMQRPSNQKPEHLATVLILLYWLVVGIGLGMYRGQLHYHYFGVWFLAPFLMLSWVLSQIRNTLARIGISMALLLVSPTLINQLPTFAQGSKLLEQTENVANEVIKVSQGEPFNFALIAEGNSDHAYRFFLELKDHIPVPLESEVTKQLLVVCEKENESECGPLGHPIWEIAGFGRAEIDSISTVHPYITVYRLKHHPESIDKIGKPAK